MRKTLILELGLVGFGWRKDQPGFGLGLIRVSALRDRVFDRLACYRDVLRMALEAIPKNDAARAAVSAFIAKEDGAP